MNVDDEININKAWHDGYETGMFNAIMNLTRGHKDIYAKGIIFCEDCKWFRKYDDTYKGVTEGADGDCYIMLMHSNDMQLSAINKNDYCSRAELKTEEER